VAAEAKVWLGFWAALVAPSPKFHRQEVGDPEDVSVNCTVCPTAGEAGLKVKDAVGMDAGLTASVWLAVLVPDPLVASNVTVYVDGVPYVWLGFVVELVVPSPKCHCQEVGEFVDVSVNWMALPTCGDLGLYVKDAAPAEGITVIVLVFVLDAAALVAVSLTL
jgi:hypothetical protein